MRRYLILAFLFLIAPLVGCHPVSPPAETHRATPVAEESADPSLTLDEALGTDPCAEQLQQVSAALLRYYAEHHKLPDRLADLPPQGLIFICPASHQPYVFAHSGLIAPGRSKRIIVYDASPAHDGKRWCILMPMQSRPSAAQSMEVLPIPEAQFRTYLPTGS